MPIDPARDQLLERHFSQPNSTHALLDERRDRAIAIQIILVGGVSGLKRRNQAVGTCFGVNPQGLILAMLVIVTWPFHGYNTTKLRR